MDHQHQEAKKTYNHYIGSVAASELSLSDEFVTGVSDLIGKSLWVGCTVLLFCELILSSEGPAAPGFALGFTIGHFLETSSSLVVSGSL